MYVRLRPTSIWVLYLVSIVTKDITSAKYVGCYFDEDSFRRFRGDFKDFSSLLTPQKCIEYCKDKGHLYAGLQYGSQCFCGDVRPSAEDSRPETDCSSKCSGDQSQKCGGSGRNSVHETGISEAQIVDKRHKYVGCFVDQEPRELGGHSQDLGDNNSPESCVAVCKEKGYVYAGLQYRYQCFCGDKEPEPAKQADERDCKHKCPSDSRFNCGGDWRMNVYKTGNPEALLADTKYKYIGCFMDQEPRELSGHSQDLGNDNSPERCINLCIEKGYVYAGLQYRFQCFCGDKDPEPTKRVDERDCKHKCPSDSRFNCGGDWRMNVYKTGNPVALVTDSRFKYVGCFLDQEPRELSGFSVDLGDNNSPERCITLCKERGFVYAGLQYRHQCFCGDKDPEQVKRADERDCKHKCPSNTRFNCGGDWRMNVYETGNPEALTIDRRYEYVGCFLDQEPRVLSGHSQDLGNDNSPERCITICKQKGFFYAGLQYRYQCFCGDKDPEPTKNVDALECKHKCPNDIRFNCGGDWRINVYKTGNQGNNNNSVENGCVASETRVNGKAVCRNQVIFEENFDTLSSRNWSHMIQIANKPDFQFVIYNSDPANAYTSDGKLVIKPSLLPDTEVRSGELHLQSCTGKPEKKECGYKAKSYNILPPVQSVRLTTSKSFSFQYGKVEISTKLPAGDWLVPEIWLEPKNEVYGPGYNSGRIRIAMSRGNNDLKLGGKDIGSRLLESGVLMGVGDSVKDHSIIRESADGWHDKYHNYSITWTPENLIFMVDGEQPHSMVPNRGQTLSGVVGFTSDDTPAWNSTSKIAPFDKDFYISLGVSIGGFRDFPDNVINNGKPKPWKNQELKALLNFWKDKDSWQPTWHDDTALLQVDYIKVTAL